MVLAYLGFATGLIVMYGWSRYGNWPDNNSSRLVHVLCAHCGVMYRTGFDNVSTANYCNQCK
jgi:hypothetical protein